MHLPPAFDTQHEREIYRITEEGRFCIGYVLLRTRNFEKVQATNHDPNKMNQIVKL